MIWFHLTGIFLLTGGLVNGVIHRHACDVETGRGMQTSSGPSSL